MNTENYTHLAVNKFTNLIVNGWDYADVEPSELKEFKNDYFIVDLKDYGFNPKVYKIVTSKFAEKNGINQWSNTGVYPLEEEYKMKDEGINFSEKAYEEHPDWFYEDVSESIKRNNTNKDMKQTIKLSESELKKIVAESVKGAINELDWKTYASAAKKRAEQGASDYDVHQLDQAANKALSDKYKITGDGHFPYSPQIDTRKGESVYDTDEEGNYVKKYPHAGQTGRFPQLGYQGDFNDTYYTPIGDNVEDEPYERTTYDNFPAHKERHKDMSSYFSGKSKYEKGKGWSNESMNRKIDRIVAESVKGAINELDWKTVVNAANKSRADFNDMVTRRAMGKLDPYGKHSELTGQYGPHSDHVIKKSWASPKGSTRRVNKDDEIQRKMKQAINLSKFADDAIKDKFGKDSYYNNLNGVGKEFPAFRKIRQNKEFDEPEVLDYFPNDDYVKGEYDDYELTSMPQKYQDKAKEINDFQNGKTKYIKGKGWSNESITKKIDKIVSETLKRTLK